MPANAILSLIGKLYLHLRYRSRQQVARQLAAKYNNLYRNAGVVVLFDLLMALAIVAACILVAVLLYFVIA